MLQTVSHDIRRSRRPWWLLLALALFFGGQTLAAVHHHDEDLVHKGQLVDHDCALCVYASMAAAIGDAGWLFAIPLIVAAWFALRVSLRRAAVRFFDSRAPPVLL